MRWSIEVLRPGRWEVLMYEATLHEAREAAWRLTHDLGVFTRCLAYVV